MADKPNTNFPGPKDQHEDMINGQLYPEYPYSSQVPIPSIAFHDFILKFIKENRVKNPERKVFISADDEHDFVTLDDIYTTSQSLACFLDKCGFSKGQVACVSLPNSWRYVPIYVAVSMNGGATTGLSDQYTEYETIRQLNDSTASLIITTMKNLAKILKVLPECPNPKTIILLDYDQNSITSLVPNKQSVKIYSWQDAISNPTAIFNKKVHIDPKNDVMAIPYSSGTTGAPKGVMITHYNYVAQIIALAKHAGKFMTPYMYDPNKKSDITYAIAYLPLYHAYGFCNIFMNMVFNRTVIIISKFSPELMLKMVENYKIESIPLVPSLLNALAKSSIVNNYDLSSLTVVTSSAGPLDEKFAKILKQRLPNLNYILQAYGMTELCICSHAANLSVKTSLGKVNIIPVPNVECKIVDPSTGKRCKVHEIGEICIRSPTIMKGYWNNPQATKEIIDQGGWLHTGDIGSEDLDGSLTIHDRIKDLIKVKGYQVPPAELEGIILTHPDVKDVAVVGIPHASYGEVPRAFIVKRNPMLNEGVIVDFVKEHVSHYKHLKGGVEFVDEVPRNQTGKILRRILKERFEKNNNKSKL